MAYGYNLDTSRVIVEISCAHRTSSASVSRTQLCPAQGKRQPVVERAPLRRTATPIITPQSKPTRDRVNFVVDDEPAVALGLVQGHFGGGDHPGHRGGKREEGGGGGTEKVAALRNRFAPSRAFRFFFPHAFEKGEVKKMCLCSRAWEEGSSKASFRGWQCHSLAVNESFSDAVLPQKSQVLRQYKL